MLEVAQAIEGLPCLDPTDPRPQEEPAFFTMAAVAYRCGTPGCIAGWAERLRPRPKWQEPAPIHDGRSAIVGAAGLFGITAKQAFRLFEPRFVRADIAAMPTEEGFICGERAASELRRWVVEGAPETADACWPKEWRPGEA